MHDARTTSREGGRAIGGSTASAPQSVPQRSQHVEKMPARSKAALPARQLGLLRGPMTADKRVLMAICDHNIRRVQELLTTGASVGGSAELVMKPIAVAAFQGQVDIVELLLERGANLEASAPDREFGVGGDVAWKSGWRAVHAAIFGGQVIALDALIKAGANLNATDSEGETPLMAASCGRMTDLEEGERCALVRALLEGGADPAVTATLGATALHYAARSCYTDVMGIILSSAPSMLNLTDRLGCTPLFYAAMLGHRTAVSLLLSAGASEKAALAQTGTCALQAAIETGHEDIVRLLLDEGLKAVGGMRAICKAVEIAINVKRATFLQMILSVQIGAGMNEKYWAQKTLKRAGVPPLHFAAEIGSLRVIHVLLAAGADEAALSSDGKRARDYIGKRMTDHKDAATEAAIGRMLERGPAFRARSWMWLARFNSASGEISASPSAEVPLGARIYRPRGKQVFPTRFAR